MSSTECSNCILKSASQRSRLDLLDHAVCHRFQQLSPNIFSSGEIDVRIIDVDPEAQVLPLRLTAPLFRSLMLRYQIKQSLLPILFKMGEAPYPAERGGSNFASSSYYIASTSDLQYCTYDLQYIEDNKRSKENPWSVRHLGVYHHRDPLSNSDLWILLCPSPDGPVQRMLDVLLQSGQDTLQDVCDDPFRLHVLLNHHYACNMQWYLRALGEQIEDQEDEAFTLDVAPSTSTLNFEAIRCFRHLDSTLVSARALCNNNLSISHALNALQTAHDHVSFYRQQDQNIRGYLEGIGVLRGKISNSIAVLSHGLDLKNGQTAAALDEHLLSLTRNTVDDSLTVKIITIVG
ncbi:MAG: hypothetical protein LQ352_002932 [Teloschistes flavicans]|nr:MAG: hypothetical protein LQ352_002932 [Teloschistes flavicans]